MIFQPFAPIACDSYKLGHHMMYPAGTTQVYSNFTPRSTKHSPIPTEYDDGKIVVFGTQFVLTELHNLWNNTFFSQPWETIEPKLSSIVAPFVGDTGFNQGLSNFADLHKLGYLPLLFKALPEGTVVDTKIPVFTVTNTHPDFFWLVGYIETYLSQQAWKMSTVATISRTYRRILSKYADQTGGSPEFIDFQAHDFSARGLSGTYDNAMVGAAHLTSFKGTDSLLGVQLINEYYNGQSTFVGASVPATEHSVMTALSVDGELDMFRNLLHTYNKGIVSIVADSYDFWKVITEFTSILRDDILNRKPDSLGMSKVVFRPDSGDPVDIICGTAIPFNDFSNMEQYFHNTLSENGVAYAVIKENFYKVVKIRGKNGYRITKDPVQNPTPEMKGAVECLYESFGGSINSKGYKQLSDRVGLIYGDSITMTRADTILSRLATKGFASDNIVFGVGSYSYQMLTRDTFGYAMKSTYQERNKVGYEIYKDPATDSGIKKSARGLLRVDVADNNYTLTDQVSLEQESGGALQVIYQDGNFYNQTNIEVIRSNLVNSYD